MIIYGNQNYDHPRNISIGQYVLDHITLFASEDDVCLQDGMTGETLTYKETVQYIVSFAVSLSKLGVKRGDVIAIGCKPFLKYIPTTLAATALGAAVTSYELETGADMLKHKLQLTKPKCLICCSQFWQNYQGVLKGFDCIKTFIAISDVPEFSYSLKSLAAENVDCGSFKPSDIQGTDIALILYSSGTTGLPKAVEISHSACVARSSLGLDRKNISVKRALFLSPFTGSFTIFGTFRFLILGQRTIFTVDRSTEALLKADIILSNPVHVRGVANSETCKDLDSVRLIVSAGFPASADTIQLFKERFPRVELVVQSYGSTETSIATSELYAPTTKSGSIGVVAPGTIIKVVDPDTQAVLGPNQPGEICIKGPCLMKGYIDVDRSTYMDEDGFFRTGDVGYFDEEKYFYIVERIKDLIFGRFAKVSPVELEHVLLQHPAVMDAAVVGKSDPDLNEVPAAFVVKRPGYDVTENELMDLVAAKVSPDKQLRGGVRFITEIPRNAGGKTSRLHLKDMLKVLPK